MRTTGVTARGIVTPIFQQGDDLVTAVTQSVCRAAETETPAPASELLPVYLRLSQAERERQARLSQR